MLKVVSRDSFHSESNPKLAHLATEYVPFRFVRWICVTAPEVRPNEVRGHKCSYLIQYDPLLDLGIYSASCLGLSTFGEATGKSKLFSCNLSLLLAQLSTNIRGPVIGTLLRGKDRFGHHHVNAVITIDHLGNVEIGSDAREHVGVFATEMFLLHKKINHFADGELCCFG
jgi:hypothetical protein